MEVAIACTRTRTLAILRLLFSKSDVEDLYAESLRDFSMEHARVLDKFNKVSNELN